MPPLVALQMKKLTIPSLLVLAFGTFTLANAVHAQDAAAPIRRSTPSEEASPTPTPAAADARATPAPAPQSPAAEEAATPARRVIKEPAVRPAISRPAAAPKKSDAEPRAAQDPALVPRTKPTFDLADQGAGYVGGTVRALENRWQNAIVKHDVSAIDELIADDFVGTSATGRLGSKSTLLYEVKRDSNTYTSATTRNLTVRSYGGRVVVVAGIAKESGTTTDGRRFDDSRRFTDTWMERGGKWQCISSHATQLPKK
jgi:ketosteroid isomerase-like protein